MHKYRSAAADRKLLFYPAEQAGWVDSLTSFRNGRLCASALRLGYEASVKPFDRLEEESYMEKEDEC
jgi:hypothetical protein